MTCKKPSDHTFETQSSYEKLTETQNAVVEKKREQKVCTDCGTPIDEVEGRTSTETTQTSEPTHQTTETTGASDAVFIEDADDNTPTSTEQRDTQSRTDDAMILDDSAETLDSDNAEADDSLDTQWESGDSPLLVCPKCEFTRPQERAPQYPGDSCPDCGKAYLDLER